MAEIADWVPYESPSGEKGHKGLLMDASSEPFYKPIGRLAWQATKAGFRKAGNYLGGTAVPTYVPRAA